jgi:hypothetical protein
MAAVVSASSPRLAASKLSFQNCVPGSLGSDPANCLIYQLKVGIKGVV